MLKSDINARMDIIAGVLQDLDYLHSWTEAQLNLYETLAAEVDELLSMLKEAA